MPLVWKPEQAKLAKSASQRMAVLHPDNAVSIEATRWFWDFAPVTQSNGSVFTADGVEYWLALTAPKSDDPEQRHFCAKLGLLSLEGEIWNYLGELMPDGHHPGNREWAGMAVLDDDFLSVYFTSAGISGRTGGYEQKLFVSTATWLIDGRGPLLRNWTDSVEILPASAGPYRPADQSIGEPGRIHAYRDPFAFTDDAGQEFLVFSATSADVCGEFGGTIGLGYRNAPGGEWRHRGPLVISDGVTTEMERAHVIAMNDLFYLFWSTPAYTFSPACEDCPTGLYGAVSDRPDGGYRLLNETGLVVANPVARPQQCYSWFVTQDLRAVAFIDRPEQLANSDSACPHSTTQRFAGTVAPIIELQLLGDRSRVVSRR